MKRKVFALIIALAMIAMLPTSVLADPMTGNEDSSAEIITEDDFDVAEALAYASTPDGLYPFLYTGSAPSIWMDINVSGCEVGKLYVYNEATTEVTKISEDTATTFAATLDSLFYVTTAQTIVRTNYSGSDLSTIYTATYGAITNFTSYGTYLYFVEGEGNAVLFDTLELTAEVLLSDEDLVTFFMVDIDKMIWYSMGDEPHYYDASSGENYELANEAEANFIVGTLVNSKLGGSTGEYATNAVIIPTGYNNISIPLYDYPAVMEKNEIYEPTNPSSYFTGTYASSNECDGFAKLAHDRFFHIADATRIGPSWSIYSNDYKTRAPWVDQSEVEEFFSGLKMGDFIRYISRTDETPSNGTHSVFFVGLDSDGEGIWVYECNQDERCGVGYQYYPFYLIYNRYLNVLYYIHHTFSDTPTYYSTLYHDMNCQNCDGCLRRYHSSASVTSISGARHQYVFSCCGRLIVEAHNMLAGHCTVCNYPDDPPGPIAVQKMLIERAEQEALESVELE